MNILYGQVIFSLKKRNIYLGGSGADANFNGGHVGSQADVRAALQKARAELQEKMIVFTRFEKKFILFIFYKEIIQLTLKMENLF
jgi:hypothetical protein